MDSSEFVGLFVVPGAGGEAEERVAIEFLGTLTLDPNQQDLLSADVEISLPGAASLTVHGDFEESGIDTKRFVFVLNTDTLFYNFIVDGPLNPNDLDSVDFYLGNRPPQQGDPVLTETLVDSNSFTGNVAGFADVYATVSGLGSPSSTEIDAFSARVRFETTAGSITLTGQAFEETAADSNRYVAAVMDNSGVRLWGAGGYPGVRVETPVLTEVSNLPQRGQERFLPLMVVCGFGATRRLVSTGSTGRRAARKRYLWNTEA